MMFMQVWVTSLLWWQRQEMQTDRLCISTLGGDPGKVGVTLFALVRLLGMNNGACWWDDADILYSACSYVPLLSWLMSSKRKDRIT
jgi:hypothetical protein